MRAQLRDCRQFSKTIAQTPATKLAVRSTGVHDSWEGRPPGANTQDEYAGHSPHRTADSGAPVASGWIVREHRVQIHYFAHSPVKRPRSRTAVGAHIMRRSAKSSKAPGPGFVCFWGVEAAVSLPQSHRRKWGAKPPTSADGFVEGGRPFRPQKSTSAGADFLK